MKEFIENLIKRAGNKLKDCFKREYKLIEVRGATKEIVTKYDKMIDKFIVREIKKKYPSHNILSEEGGLKKGSSNFLWLIDSLDGTANFANKNPLFSICIALMKGKEIILGAIFAPIIGEFYFAEKGKGAFLNGKRIKVSNVSEMEKSYIVYCEGKEKNRWRIAEIINKIYPNVTDLRKIGSAGLETGWVGAGRADAYFTTKIEPWDIAAGVLLVEEAGGKVSDFKGNFWEIATNDFLFSNKKIHQKILSLISNL